MQEVRHNDDGVVERAWSTLTISRICGLVNTQGKNNIELFMCACQPILSTP